MNNTNTNKGSKMKKIITAIEAKRIIKIDLCGMDSSNGDLVKFTDREVNSIEDADLPEYEEFIDDFDNECQLLTIGNYTIGC